MNVLVVGAGGREHAIIKKLKENPRITKIFAAPGNGGIFHDAECIPAGACDIKAICDICRDKQIDFAVVAPDDPLVAGMVDALGEIGVRTFGPNKAAAYIEGSKVYSKELMKKYNIPTAKYESFDDSSKAVKYIEEQNTYPIVIKADGLALGKGVIIAENLDAAKQAVISIMEEKQFGDSGNRIVVEEFLTGPEVSVLTFCDSKTIIPMVSSMDHKRALDDDKGLNTGGMGTIAPNPFYTPEIASECMEKIFIPTMEALNKEGRPFKGCIFFGLMITPHGPKTIEYNCRFGDPETQVVLPLLESDLFDIFEAIYDEKLADIDVKFSESKASACVVAASGGYPVKYQTGYEINGLDKDGGNENAIVYHAGTKYENEKFLTSGGRVLGITAVGNDVKDALNKAYTAADSISFKDMHYRKDIGKQAIKEN